MPGLKVRVVAGFVEGGGDGDVDALQHRGQDRAGVQVVLVAVDADRELAGVGGGLQHAEARTAGGGEDDVGASVELRLGRARRR